MKGQALVLTFIGVCVAVAFAAIIYGVFTSNNDLRERCEQLGGVYLTRGENCVVGIEGWAP